MITNNILERLQMYSIFADAPIICIEDISGDNKYIIAYDFIEFNPSNHIHKNHIRKGKEINSIINLPNEIDASMFTTKLMEINFIALEFSNLYKWFKVR